MPVITEQSRWYMFASQSKPGVLYTIKQTQQGHGRATGHRPELILNRFDTRLGRRVARMLASLFHQDPQFKGRRAVTFHNQRDFVFFR